MAAEGHLAVGADCFDVAGGHFAEGFGVVVGWFGGAASGGHVGVWVLIKVMYAVGTMLSNEWRLCESVCPVMIPGVVMTGSFSVQDETTTTMLTDEV